jgi:hypothetical protein
MSQIYLITHFDTRIRTEDVQLPQVRIVHVSHNYTQLQNIMLEYARNQVLEVIDESRKLKDLQYLVNVTNLHGEQVSRPDWGKTQDEIAAIYEEQIRHGSDVNIYHHNHTNDTPDVSRWVVKPKEINWVRENYIGGGIYTASRWEIHEIEQPRLYIPPTIIRSQDNIARIMSTPVQPFTKTISDTHISSFSSSPSSSSYQTTPSVSPCSTSSISPCSEMSSSLSSADRSPMFYHMGKISSVQDCNADTQKIPGNKRHRKLYE